MISIGQTHSLRVTGQVAKGALIDAGELGSALLPNKHCPAGLQPGDQLDVFLYLDSEQGLIATTQQPKAQVGEFAYLKAVSNTDYGTFLDWGLDKDLLVPFGEQHRPMEVGRSYLVQVYLSKADGRITASSKVDKFLDDLRPHSFEARQAVNLIIANSTELGYKAIINHSHWGVLYGNEVAERLSFGQSKKGFIKAVRADGKIDLTLDGGQESRDEHTRKVLDYLRNNNNFCSLSDKSDPERIQALFGMSKRSYKKTLGGLYKQRAISIQADGIRLIEDAD